MFMRRKLCFHRSAVAICNYLCFFTCNLVPFYVPLIMYVGIFLNLHLSATFKASRMVHNSKSGFKMFQLSFVVFVHLDLGAIVKKSPGGNVILYCLQVFHRL